MRGHYLTQHPIPAFLLLAFTLSWPFLLVGFGWFVSEQDILKRYLFSCTGMLMVALSAFITRLLIERKGLSDAGWNPGRLSWYLGALIWLVFMWLGPPVGAFVFGKLDTKRPFTSGEVTVVALSLAGFSWLAGFGEEFGWRGYLIPRMLTERKRSREVLILIGLIWGVWHCAVDIGPLFRTIVEGEAGWVSQIGLTLLNCFQSIAASVALSFIFGALWLKSRSMLLLFFFHGYWIGIRDSVALLFSFPVIFRLVSLAAVLTAWFVAYVWLQKYERVISHGLKG
jgi:hypothetical protein